MKNLLVFTFILIIGCTGTKKMSYSSFDSCKCDTTQYLQQKYIDQKQKYIGKKLDVLLKDLDIPVKSYINHSVANNMNITDAIYISFLNDEDTRVKLHNYNKRYMLIITWETPLPTSITNKLIREHPEGWGKAEIDYFGQQIIKNIEL